MLNVQEYLREKSFADLTRELGIEVTAHETLPLAILNYSQIQSPKTHPVVRECRGLVLHTETHAVIAKAFDRFFNWGEVAEEMRLFDFSDFTVQEKVDGSLVLLYHFGGRWHANTRGSFGQGKMHFSGPTWHEGFCKALGVGSLQSLNGRLNERLTYVCEFCSPWNKVVRRYTEPTLYLLSVFEGTRELDPRVVDAWALQHFVMVPRYRFSSIEEIQEFLAGQSESDPTFEGVVIRDQYGRRWKIKSPTYLALHAMSGNGNIFHPKNLLPFALSGETDELLTYFPEVEEEYHRCKACVDEAYSQLEGIWAASQGIASQKDYALSILGKTPFTGLLFTLRKQHGPRQPLEALKKAWRENGDDILKHVFKRQCV